MQARKNRNITLTRMRPALGEIGDFRMINNEQYISLTFGDEVFCDYSRLKELFALYETNPDDDAVLREILKLVSRGPLLPHVQFEWLDSFKEEFTIQAVETLSKIMQREIERNNWDTVHLIANAILTHENLNEEAIVAKCRALINKGRVQQARESFDKFRYEYMKSMGIDPALSFKAILRNAAE